MRMTRPAVTALILVLAAGLCPAQAPTEPVPTKGAASEVKSLVREDLLQIIKKEASPPLRNIFAPRAGPSRTGDIALPGRPLPAVDFPVEDESAATDETAEAAPALPVALRYIGFLQSPRRLVALVLFERLAIAVGQGEV